MPKRRNPYKFTGPLDPGRDQAVCVPRTMEVNRVIEGILSDNSYWAILGPRHIGKTTLLRQIQKELAHAYYVYFNFEIAPHDAKSFYHWVTDQILTVVPTHQNKPDLKNDNWNDEPPEFVFLRFLEDLIPQDESKRIIFLFDEIDDLPSRRTFLHIWRKIFHDRFNKFNLNRYTVIISGSVDLIAMTNGPTSPFNIAEILYLENFNLQECDWLVCNPMKQLGIQINHEAIELIRLQLSGHPQMLQQLCSILTGETLKSNRIIREENVKNAIENLLTKNTTLDILIQELKINNILTGLLQRIIVGERIGYFPFKELSIAGVGAIIEDTDHNCLIRNKIFERVIKYMLSQERSHQEESGEEEEPIQTKPVIFISYSHKDTKWKNLIATHLKVLEFEEILFAWDDSKIDAGQDWYPEIEKHMKRADVALFLISKDSLTSGFIRKEEIPLLLERRKNDGLIFFPILVKPCSWKNVPWLASIQIRPKEGKPLSAGSINKQDERCVEIINEISGLLKERGKLS